MTILFSSRHHSTTALTLAILFIIFCLLSIAPQNESAYPTQSESEIRAEYESVPFIRDNLDNLEKRPSDGRPYYVDTKGKTVDWVISVSYVHCSIKVAALEINRIFNPKRIIFLSKERTACPVLESFADNIKCVWEQTVFPNGFNAKEIVNMINERGKEDIDYLNGRGAFMKVTERPGWYFLQLMNLGISLYMDDLSDNYIVWDSDIIPLESRRTFFNDKGEAIFYTQRNHGLPEITHGYHKSFEHLFGFRITHPPGQNVPEDDAKSSITWVAHQMIFKREYVTEMMRYIENNRGVDKDSWMVESTKIWLQSDMKPYRMFGFADYDMYGSWIHQKHPDKLEVLLKSYELWELFERAPGYEWGTCCPPRSIYNEKLKDGSHYFLNEVHKSDPKCKDSLNTYGVKEIPEEYADLFPKR
mmetsp:Transcript_673/g.2297  ORF Transcript_673/g.2297 Transcript_673/m.2297 type:complete len:416 (-) Transcript_673:84-1331(-)